MDGILYAFQEQVSDDTQVMLSGSISEGGGIKNTYVLIMGIMFLCGPHSRRLRYGSECVGRAYEGVPAAGVRHHQVAIE